MSIQSTKVKQAALNALYYTGAHRAIAPMTQGIGVVFMLHSVSPEPAEAFEPNRILRITPHFLDQVISLVRRSGYEIISLDDMHGRLASGQSDQPFACFTFDDGYRDNLVHAYPVFRRHRAPMAVYVPTDYADGRGELWWLALERVVARSDKIAVTLAGIPRVFATTSARLKEAAYAEIYWHLRAINEADCRQIVAEMCLGVGLCGKDLCRNLIMTWDEVRQIAADPLVTIGAHSCAHYALAQLSASAAFHEMETSVARIGAALGRRPAHFSYPYGSTGCAGVREYRMATELGMKTGVTTRKGLIFPEHGNHLTALPRVSLNGDYQSLRFVSALLSGAPTYVWNGFRRVGNL